MSDFLTLGAGERYYFGSPDAAYVTQTPAILELTQRPTPITITIAQKQKTEPATGSQTYRNAGRKKLTNDLVARNLRLADERKAKLLTEIADRRATKAANTKQKKEALANRAIRANQAKADLELVMQMGNKQAPAGEDTLPEGAVIVKGLLEMPGKTCIRIDGKTTIYVNHGKSLRAAVEKHLLALKVNRIH